METENKRIPQIPCIKKAIYIYYAKIELATRDIRNLFSCCSTTATRLKNIAMEHITEQKIPIWDAGRVNTKAAYEAWGLDIKDLEERQKKLEKIEVITNGT